MKIKFFEIRDEGTCIAAMGIAMIPDDKVSEVFLTECGYPKGDFPTIILMQLSNQRATSDPYEWKSRTMLAAHQHIQDNFFSLTSGAVVDARVVLGENDKPADPEIIWHPGLLSEPADVLKLLARGKGEGE